MERIFDMAVVAGADDVNYEDGVIEITGPVEVFKTLSDALRQAGYTPEEAGLRLMPNSEIELDVESTLQVMRCLDNLEELDDVQNVYHNLRISEEALAALEEG
jgi:transcriptional/translational regulatory protein YebC/TACO1